MIIIAVISGAIFSFFGYLFSRYKIGKRVEERINIKNTEHVNDYHM